MTNAQRNKTERNKLKMLVITQKLAEKLKTEVNQLPLFKGGWGIKNLDSLSHRCRIKPACR